MLAPVPIIAQSYVVKHFIKIVFHFCRICINDFLAKKIRFLQPTFAYCLVISNHTSGVLSAILSLP
jgi:hypothetical protein